MKIEAGQRIEVNTKSFGIVKVWNFSDKEVHFEWKNRFRTENGNIDLSTGAVSNVPQQLIMELEL